MTQTVRLRKHDPDCVYIYIYIYIYTKGKLRAQPSEVQEVAIIFARMVEGTYRPKTSEHGTSSLGLDISTQ